jgi:hypothetical protein
MNQPPPGRRSIRRYRRFVGLVVGAAVEWLSQLFQGAISAVITLLALGSVTVVLIRLDPLWLAVLVVVLAGWALAQGAFSVWDQEEQRASTIETELARLRRAPVPDKHRAVLRKFVSDVVRELEHPRPLFLPPDSPFAGPDGALLAGAYGAHFPALAPILNEYTKQGQRLQDAQTALTARLVDECATRGIAEPTYNVLQVHGILCPVLRAIAEDRRDATNFRFAWQVCPDPPPPATGWPTTASVSTAGSEQPTATLPAEPSDDLRSRADEITDRVDRLFTDALKWIEMHDIRVAHDALLSLQPAALDQARLDATREQIRMTPDCRICALNLDGAPLS